MRLKEHTLNKTKFLKSLNYHPDYIKYLVAPTSDLIKECIVKNNGVVGFLKPEYLTLDILRDYLKTSYIEFKDLRKFPQDVLDSLPAKERDEFVDNDTDAAAAFVNAPNSFWITYVATDSNMTLKKIPEHQKTPLFLDTYYPHHIDEKYPEGFLTEDRIISALKVKDDCGDLVTEQVIRDIPDEFITRRVIEAAFKANPNLELNRDLPEEILDEDLVKVIIKQTPQNVAYLPDKFITRKTLVRAVKADPSNYRLFPVEMIDEEIAILVLSRTTSENAVTLLKKYCSTKEHLIALAEADNKLAKADESFYGINNFFDLYRKTKGRMCEDEKTFTSEYVSLLVEALKVCPYYIKEIEKPDQTNELVDAFVSVASPELIDKMTPHIDLRRIKKANVPFLLGVNSKIGSVCERKVRGRVKSDPIVVVPEKEVVVKMPPKILTNIKEGG